MAKHRKKLSEWSIWDTLFGAKPGTVGTHRWPPEGSIERFVNGLIEEVHIIPRVRSHWYTFGAWKRTGGVNLVQFG